MKNWLFSRLKEYETTIAGVVIGGAVGAGMTIQSGQITKEALIIGACIGAVGAVSKTPTFARVFGRVQDDKQPGGSETGKSTAAEGSQGAD